MAQTIKLYLQLQTSSEQQSQKHWPWYSPWFKVLGLQGLYGWTWTMSTTHKSL